MNDFTMMQKFVDEMRSTSSSIKKKEILEKYKDEEFVLKCLQYTLDPYKMFGVTSKAFKKYIPSCRASSVHDSLFELLDDLVMRKISGYTAFASLDDFILRHVEHKDLILQIIDKDLEIRASASIVNKVFSGLVPEFNVALANEYKEKLVDYEFEEWYVSRKLDGLRCICRIDDQGDARFYSRSGKEFHTLDVLKASVKKEGLVSRIFDGEICIMNGELEDFTEITKQYNRKNHTIKNPKFFIFDSLTLEEFDSGTSTRTLYDRILEVRIPDEHFEVLDQKVVYSDKSVLSALDEAVEKGQEGVILRKNAFYKGKRSNDLLKVKKFSDAEYKVLGVVFGSMRFLEAGRDIARETLSAVVIEHKGYKVQVGSGFSKEQRAEYYKDPTKITGKVITVRYFEESKNQTGGMSLRFPTVKIVHEGERTV